MWADGRIVRKDINGRKLLKRNRRHVGNSLRITYISHGDQRLDPKFFRLGGEHLAGLPVFRSVDDHITSALCQLKHDRPSDLATRPRYKCGSCLCIHCFSLFLPNTRMALPVDRLQRDFPVLSAPMIPPIIRIDMLHLRRMTGSNETRTRSIGGHE